MLDLPCGAVPWGVVTETDRAAFTAGYARTADMIAKNVGPATNEGGFVGQPLSVQIVAGPYQEEMCLAVMRAVEGVAPAVPRPKMKDD